MLRTLLRRMPDPIRWYLAKTFICSRRGHLSTGSLLWWMCDRCHEDFRKSAKPSYWDGDTKITRSR